MLTAHKPPMKRGQLSAWLKPFAGKIADVDRDQDGFSVGLVYGWYCPETETHCIHENTLPEIARRMRSVVRCSPATCKAEDCGPFQC